MPRLGWWLAVVLAALTAAPAVPAPPQGLATAAWKLESIELRDGRRLEGLVLDSDAGDATDDIRFAQVKRPPGRPMYVIIWGPLAAERVAAVDRLPAAEHAQLASRVRSFLDGRQRQAEAETAVRLEQHDEDGPWQHESESFTVTSTADPATTRAAIVTLEQVFGGLETLVAAAASPERKNTIEVRLCGSAAEYRDVQRSLGIAIDSPAFYMPSRRLLVAGSDMPALAAGSAAVDDELAAAAQRYDQLDRLLDERLKALAGDLEQQGFPAAERAAIVQRARQRWERERGIELTRIAAARRDNAAALDRARRAFRQRLVHEAWHAYADTRLRAADAGGLPAWLDEGLAQVVESAPLEAGELRLDAPDPRRLTALQESIRAGSVPRLADLVQTGQQQFIAGHAGRDGERGRAYLAAWGLALDLAMLRPVLSPAAIVEMTKAEGDPVQSLEKLTGVAIDRYESDWRRRILALGGTRPADPTPKREPVTPDR
ncbi:MAG: hypothetical protein K8S94_13315 [Planctomycetia bacterium]|nr:hypothetical protein [Planctomycetia bacterium]